MVIYKQYVGPKFIVYFISYFNATVVKTAAALSISALLSVMFVFIFGVRNFLSKRIWNENTGGASAVNCCRYMALISGPCVKERSQVK